MPYIKLNSVKDTLLGKSKAIEISGLDLVKNEDWTKKFFKNQNDLVEQLQEFEPGDEVNVVMEQDPNNSKWWNIKEFTAITEEDREKIEAKKKFGTKGGGGGSTAPGNPRGTGGSSRSDDMNRSSAIYLAREVVNMCGIAEANPDEVATEMIRLAHDFILPYIKDGIVPGTKAEEAPAAESATKLKKLGLPKV